MRCYHPIYAHKYWFSNGEVKLSFKPLQEHDHCERIEEVTISCGKCIGCRVSRAREWTVRCLHELQMHDKASFVTLTFDDKYLDPNGSLRKRDFQLFMKRLRKKYDGANIRYFHCGEYGLRYLRPHHHAILYGVQFEDAVSRIGQSFKVSDTLSSLWPFGFSSVGDVTSDSISYVTSYTLKKVTREPRELSLGILPEYHSMSLKPAIGKSWFDKYHSDLYGIDKAVISDSRQYKVPKYYDKLLMRFDSKKYLDIKEKRCKVAAEAYPELDSVDLKRAEEAVLYKYQTLSRKYEGGHYA